MEDDDDDIPMSIADVGIPMSMGVLPPTRTTTYTSFADILADRPSRGRPIIRDPERVSVIRTRGRRVPKEVVISSTRGKFGIVGVVVVVAIIGAAIWFLVRKSRKHS